MVEIPKHCVLQWAGHAGYVAERFSDLLARQALVDVTLVCDEQKLRVHKLVLASNSGYFEEILQQDLGLEPTIILKDLDFDILKAMIEFMYCGETTISHQHLLPLLTTAKVFQIKELVSIIDAAINSKQFLDNFENYLKCQEENNELKTNELLTENNYIHMECDEPNMEENILICTESNSNVRTSKNQSLENDMIESTEHDIEHTLYEESDINASKNDMDTSFSISNVNISIQNNIPSIITAHSKVNEVQTKCTCNNSDNTYCNSQDLKPILYEQCCDLSDINEHDQTFTILSQSCLPQAEKDFEHRFGNNTDVPSKKCVKVYTHKRRKSVDTVRNNLVHMRNLVPTPSSTDCIDLLDEPSTNDIPVTMLTSLDMESAEYILSLSTESIQSIVGGIISDQHAVIGYKEMNAEQNTAKEKLKNNVTCVKPVLRRSMRLNQQENDETISTSLNLGNSVANEKSFKKSTLSNRNTSFTKTKRRQKEDRKVPNTVSALHSSKKNFSNKKNNSKLIIRKTAKSACTVTGTKDKEESKTKTNNRVKSENMEKLEPSNNSALSSIKFNSIRYISRALWGDMSDIVDDKDSEINLPIGMSNTEIPYAVGLLPLQTALEKMQATPDYQPRKTRSSVAPMKQNTSIKRKNYFDDMVLPKKQNTNNNENSNTVCHIQIRTAPSQYIKGRKRFLPDSITSLSTTDITDS